MANERTMSLYTSEATTKSNISIVLYNDDGLSLSTNDTEVNAHSRDESKTSIRDNARITKDQLCK